MPLNKFSNVTRSLSVLLLLAAAGHMQSETESKSPLDLPIPSFSQTIETPYMVLMNLATDFSVPIGFEGVPEDPEREITISVNSGTVRSVLNKLVQVDPRYEWQLDGVIDILPKDRNETMLDVKISHYKVTNVTRQGALEALLATPEVTGLLNGLGITVRTPITRAMYDASGSIPVFNLELSGVSMRSALNAIV